MMERKSRGARGKKCARTTRAIVYDLSSNSDTSTDGNVADTVIKHDKSPPVCSKSSTSVVGNADKNAKKSARPRTNRGLSSRLCLDSDVSVDSMAEESAVYSHRVAHLLTDLESVPQIAPKITKLSTPEDERPGILNDIKHNIMSIMHEHTVSPPSPTALNEASVLEVKDPTPPPTPQSQKRPAKRVKKAVKVAMTKLQKAQKFLDGNDDVIIVDDSEISSSSSKSPSKDRTMAVKIRCREAIHRFQMKPVDSFGEIITALAAKEHLSEEDIMLIFNDRTVHPYDSPRLLGLTVADIIECHIHGAASVPSATVQSEQDLDPFLIRLFLQSTTSRSEKSSLTIAKDEPMEKLMREYCRRTGIKYGSVVFQFDGERIDPASTPESLELETDYCIDVLHH